MREIIASTNLFRHTLVYLYKYKGRIMAKQFIPFTTHRLPAGFVDRDYLKGEKVKKIIKHGKNF